MRRDLPIIDMTADEAQLAGEIGDAARNTAFFYVSGRGIDPSLIAAVFDGPHRFFALPAEVKLRQLITRSCHNRGGRDR